MNDRPDRSQTTIPDEPAFAVVDASGRIDPMSVRRTKSTCEINIFVRKLEDQEGCRVIPVRIVAA
jgi:hypothetical protein